jgi:hypothetical protein
MHPKCPSKNGEERIWSLISTQTTLICHVRNNMIPGGALNVAIVIMDGDLISAPNAMPPDLMN